MQKTMILLQSLFLTLFLSGAVAAQTNEHKAIAADINTPILKLLERSDARAIVEKHMPNLVQALDESFAAQEFLGSSSLRELEIDDDHVIGFDAAMLEQIKLELDSLTD